MIRREGDKFLRSQLAATQQENLMKLKTFFLQIRRWKFISIEEYFQKLAYFAHKLVLDSSQAELNFTNFIPNENFGHDNESIARLYGTTIKKKQ